MKPPLAAILLIITTAAGFASGRLVVSPQALTHESPGPSPRSHQSRSPADRRPPLAPKEASEPPAEVRSDEGKTAATTRVLDVFLPLLSDDLLLAVVEYTVSCDVEAQSVVLDLLLETDDPAYFELVRGFRITYERDLVKRVSDAIATETHPDRRAELAYALGNYPWDSQALGHIEGILDGKDLTLIERVLGHLKVERVRDEKRDAMILRLRNLALSAPTTEMRAGATGALEGDLSAEGIRFLLDRIVWDPEVAVQSAALGALYLDSNDPEPLKRKVVNSLYAVATDPHRDVGFRRDTARQLIQIVISCGRHLLTPEQKQLLLDLRNQEP